MKHRFANWVITKFSKWLMREPPLVPSYLSDFEKIRYELRPADILLVEGRNRVSSIIKQITQSNWSHAALYIGRLHDIEDINIRNHVKKFYKGPPEQPLLVESLMGHGTKITSLERYRDYHLRICRPSGLSSIDAQKVIAFAVDRLGMRYSVRHIFDLARFLFPWGILPRRWRSSLFEHNALKPTEEICSSMLARAFESVNFPVLPEVARDQDGFYLVRRDPRLFTPRDFDFSPFFTIVKPPMLTVNYHHLPWRKDIYQGASEIHSVPQLEEEPIQNPLTSLSDLARNNKTEKTE